MDKLWKPDKEEEIGRIEEEFRDIVVRKIEIGNKSFFDIRTFAKTENYKGYSPKGIMIAIDKKDELVELLKKV